MDEDLAKESGEDEIKGVYVARVTENGGAEQAGMKSGDVILEVDGKSVNTLSQLLEAVGQYRPGDKVNILSLRNGKRISREVKLRNQDGTTDVKNREESFYNETLGASFEAIKEADKSSFNITSGLKVTEVRDGVLSRGGIGKDFIVLQVNGFKVGNKTELENAMLKKNSRAVRIQGMYPNGMKISFEFIQ
jgi:S1-C subfamily serine protease